MLKCERLSLLDSGGRETCPRVFNLIREVCPLLLNHWSFTILKFYLDTIVLLLHPASYQFKPQKTPKMQFSKIFGAIACAASIAVAAVPAPEVLNLRDLEDRQAPTTRTSRNPEGKSQYFELT